MNGSESAILKQISEKLKTSSAVVPALLAALIAMPIGLSGLLLGKSENVLFFEMITASPLLVLLAQILIFTFVDRDRLHNEEHIERRMMIDRERSIIGDNTTQNEIVLDGGRRENNLIGKR